MRASGVAVTLVFHEHKRLGRGLDLTALAEQLKAQDVGLEFRTGELQGSHDAPPFRRRRAKRLRAEEFDCAPARSRT